MAKPKHDGVVEAVRYEPEGRIKWVRAYLRRGPTFSDRVLLDRQTLIEKLKSGKKFYAGQRKPYLASTFDISAPLQVLVKNGKEVLVTGDLQVDRDCLDGVPVI
ncbi:MAG: hypothetical protein JXB15_00080 [Anaerolineales bacterium]|nr:hypothetical protein [Anaerolineales bacterium]